MADIRYVDVDGVGLRTSIPCVGRSFRTAIVVVLALSLLAATLFVLAVGNYSASATTVKAGGWMGIVLAAMAFYLALAARCEASYGREVLWLGHLQQR